MRRLLATLLGVGGTACAASGAEGFSMQLSVTVVFPNVEGLKARRESLQARAVAWIIHRHVVSDPERGP